MRNLIVIVIFLIVILLAGTLGYVVFEDTGFWDSMYLTAMTITTVGYGDIVPHYPEGKVFTVFLVFTIYSMGSFWTLIFYFLFEVGKPLYSTVKNDLINYQVGREGRVTILSFHSLAIKLGTALGLICMGYLSDVIGLQNAWYISAIIFFSNLFLYMIVHSWMLRVPSKRVVLSVAR